MSRWQLRSDIQAARMVRGAMPEGMGELVEHLEVIHGRRGDVVMRAIKTRERWAGETEPRWHLSVAVTQPEARTPSWEEMVDLCHLLRPGVPFCMGVPPRSWWMNVHPDVLHAWETRDAPLVEQWRINARGDEPT